MSLTYLYSVDYDNLIVIMRTRANFFVLIMKG
jgi:hypothetical protein